MMAKLTEKECRIVKTLRSPMLWGQAYLKNRDGSPRQYWPHQREDLLCTERNIIHLDGRAVGKTINLTTQILHYAFVTHGGQGLIAAPHQGHLDTIIEEVEFQLGASPDLNNSVAMNKYGKPKIIRKPYFRVEYSNREHSIFPPGRGLRRRLPLAARRQGLGG